MACIELFLITTTKVAIYRKLLHFCMTCNKQDKVPNFEMYWSIISNFSSTNEKTEGHGEPIVTEPPNYTKLSKKIHLPGQRI
jgi:hypothetical protein